MHIFQDYLRFNLYGVLNIGSAFANALLGVFVYFHNPRSSRNRAYLLIILTTLVWLIGFGMMSMVRTPEQSRLWMSFSYVGGVPFISPAFYWFSQVWNDSNARFPTHAFMSAAVVATPMIFFNRRVFAVVEYPWGRYNGTIGSLSIAYTALVIGFFAYWALRAFIGFLRGWKAASDPFEKIQRRNILIAFILAYTGAADFLVTLRLSTYPFGYISLWLFLSIVGYTVVRHRLLDVRLAVKRVSLVLAIYLGLLSIGVPITIPLLHHYIQRPGSNVFSGVMTASLILGLFFSTGPFLYALLVRRTFWLKKHVAAGLMHELKSPLGAILSASDLVLEQMESGRLDDSAGYIRMIQKNATRLESFVRDLLNVTREEADELYLADERLDLVDLTSSACEQHRTSAQGKGLSLVFETDRPAWVRGDRSKLQQVISNLLSNAIKFSERGAIHVNVRAHSSYVQILVRDQGRGVPKKYLGKIFNRFFQATTGTKGTGIGLAISKAWVEAHGGRIWAESEGEGKGTTVTFTLPAISK